MCPVRALTAAIVCLALAASACTSDDTGHACGSAGADAALPADPVAGETPVVEVVRVDRDATCESFQCLSHHGLGPYCTRSCSYGKPPGTPRACATDADCTAPLHCHAGVCNDDDCPPGFVCDQVQEVGPLAGALFCVRRLGCARDFDCDDLANLRCTHLGCLDACLLPGASCAAHTLTCEPTSALHCSCANAATSCADTVLVCQPPGLTNALPQGSVSQETVCLPK